MNFSYNHHLNCSNFERNKSLTWKNLKNTPGFVDKKKMVTQEILNTSFKKAIPCPSCQNEAVLYLHPIEEYSPTEKEDIIAGYEVKKLKCQFCKLEVTDSKVLDYLKIKDGKSNGAETIEDPET